MIHRLRRGGMITVLIIDDEAPIRLLCRVNLEAEGMEVLEAADGPGGLELARTERPDIVLLDVMMPGLDGPGTLQAMRETPRMADVPVVFMTAKVQPQEIANLRSLGALGVIAKPFDPITLSATIRGIWTEHHG